MRTYPSFTKVLSISDLSISSEDSFYSPYVKAHPLYEDEGYTALQPPTYEDLAYSESFFLPDIFEDDEYELEFVDSCTTESLHSTKRRLWTDFLGTVRLFAQGIFPKSRRVDSTSAALYH